jgi:hypothetical protein
MFVIAGIAGASFIYYIFTGQELALSVWLVLTSLLIIFA